MDNLLEKITRLEIKHDGLPQELVKQKNIKLGLRNLDGTGVVVGITSKGQVKGYEKRGSHNIAVPGKLYYCGYDVEEIAGNIEREGRFGFEETAYLLLTSTLPSSEDLSGFVEELSQKRDLPELARQVIEFDSVCEDQMGALHVAVSALQKYGRHPKTTDVREVTRQCINLIAKLPTIIAFNYHVMQAEGKSAPDLVEPRSDLSTAENFLYMLKGELPDDKAAHIFDIALILHAEHGGGNNSTFTVRTVSSSRTDTYMAICAGIASLAGHLHGGANEAVMGMMDAIKTEIRDWNDDDAIKSYLRETLEGKRGDGSGKLYGFGHAVYTISDPREPILKAKAHELASEAGRLDEFNLYEKIAMLAPKVIRKAKGKRTCPNVDFYSGFVYDMMGIPRALYTPIFAMARVAGWSAHRIEEIIQGRLIRPSYVPKLSETRSYTPISER